MITLAGSRELLLLVLRSGLTTEYMYCHRGSSQEKIGLSFCLGWGMSRILMPISFMTVFRRLGRLLS